MTSRRLRICPRGNRNRSPSNLLDLQSQARAWRLSTMLVFGPSRLPYTNELGRLLLRQSLALSPR